MSRRSPPSGAFPPQRQLSERALLAVNLGDDADTAGAVYGQLAGAFYDEEGIPEEWRDLAARREEIFDFADRLLEQRPRAPYL